VADYKVLQMTAGFPIVQQFTVYLDAEDLLEVEVAAKGHKFRFPISYASDMSQVSILRTLYWADDFGTIISQKFGPNPAHREPCQDAAGDSIPPRPLGPRAQYRRLFTPCGQYLAHIERQNDFNDSSEGLWTFSIWEKGASDAHFMGGTAWRKIASLDDVYGDFLIDGDVAFNPRYQIIALMQLVPKRLGIVNLTSIWNFRAIPLGSCNDEKTTKIVYGTGLRNLNFSPCGKFLSGDHFWYKEKRVVDVGRFMAYALPVLLPTPDDLSNPELPMTATSQIPTGGVKHPFQMGSKQSSGTVKDHHHAMPSSNALTLATRDGTSVIQTIRTYSDGAVVLKSYSPTIDTEECLIYLPDGTQKSVSVTSLNSDDDSGNLRIVLTPNSQDTYKWNDPSSRQSVTVISRPTASIRQYKVLHDDRGQSIVRSRCEKWLSFLLTYTGGVPCRRACANADDKWRAPSDSSRLKATCVESKGRVLQLAPVLVQDGPSDRSRLAEARTRVKS
jgi:hypothetical protein